MKNRILKSAALLMCAVMTVTGGSYVFAAGGNETGSTESENTALISADSKATDSLSKEETVFVVSGADGKAEQVISSVWLKNPEKLDVLEDATTLDDIENVKGNETFERIGETLKWNAGGRDIYYRGTSNKALPVTMSVKYTLDGKEVSPEDIAGASGKVSIKISFTNNEYRTVEIAGKKERIYVPFAVVAGTALDNEVFSNIEVSGGRAVNDGDRTAIVGIALPGLSETLGAADESIDIPDCIEISADAENFRLDMILALALNDVFDSVDTEKLNSIPGLKEQMTAVTSAISQITEGSEKLYEGLDELYTKSGELTAGIGSVSNGASKVSAGNRELATGAKELSDGADRLTAATGGTDVCDDGALSLKDGARELKTGTSALLSGLGELSSNSEAIREGAKTVFDTLLKTAGDQLSAAGLLASPLTAENYAEILNGIIASLDGEAVYSKALESVTAAVESQKNVIEEKVSEAVRASVREKVIESAAGLSVEEYEAALSAGLIDATTSSQIEAACDARMASDEVKALIASGTENEMSKLISEAMSGEEVQSQLAAASEGAKKVIALKTSLDSYNSFYLGLISYTSGVDAAFAGAAQLDSGAAELSSGADQISDGAAELGDGAKKLAAGAAELSSGADELADGASTLNSATPALQNGVKALRDGAKSLFEGVSEFSETALGKISEITEKFDIDALSSKLSATVNASKDYRSFSGISERENGSVKFIYRTEEIKAN